MHTRPRHAGRILILLSTLTLAIIIAGSASFGTNAALASARLGDKGKPDGAPAQVADGVTRSGPPEPGSKNDSVQPASDPNGVTRSGSNAFGPKDRANAPAAQDIGATAATPSGWRFTTCGQSPGSSWTTTSATFQTIVSCTANFAEPGFVYINATTSVGLAVSGAAFEARFNVSVDSTSGNSATDRWVNVYPDTGGDGTDKSAADSLLTTVSAGSHTFYFLGARYAGTGTVQLYDPSISVLFFPSSATDVLSCGDSGNLTWQTTSTTFQTVRSCAISAPQSGFVYISGTSSLGRLSNDYEGRFRLGVDTTTGTSGTDRWVNTYSDSGDGVDENIAISLLTSVGSGSHTFYFLGALYSGSGPVQLYDPTLSVIYLPAPNVTAKVCGASGSDVWTNSTTSYTTLRSCTVNFPRGGAVFVDANGSAGLNATGASNEWEGQFRIGVDDPAGNSSFDRWVNVYTDSGDGTDRAVADSGIINVSAGTHTFYFVGKRYAGTGTLRVYSPSLTVFGPAGSTFLPLIIK